jgi:hypothetical protein
VVGGRVRKIGVGRAVVSNNGVVFGGLLSRKIVVGWRRKPL